MKKICGLLKDERPFSNRFENSKCRLTNLFWNGDSSYVCDKCPYSRTIFEKSDKILITSSIPLEPRYYDNLNTKLKQ